MVEKLILEKNADFIVGGPVRSEAALAAMDLLSKYKKVSILTTGALTPAYHARVAKEYDKFKYCFRISGEVGWMVTGEFLPCLMGIKEKYNFNKLFIMIQDVAHARGGGDLVAKLATEKGWEVLGKEIYPTGTTDYSVGLLKARKENAQVILIWMDMPETSILLKQWYDMKIPALPFGTIISAAEEPGFWKASEGKGEYCYGQCCQCRKCSIQSHPMDDEVRRSLYKEMEGRTRRLWDFIELYGGLYSERCY